jgi:hypothetical protein
MSPTPFESPIYVTRPFLPPLADFRDGLQEIWSNEWLTNNGPVLQRFQKELCARSASPDRLLRFRLSSKALIEHYIEKYDCAPEIKRLARLRAAILVLHATAELSDKKTARSIIDELRRHRVPISMRAFLHYQGSRSPLTKRITQPNYPTNVPGSSAVGENSTTRQACLHFGLAIRRGQKLIVCLSLLPLRPLILNKIAESSIQGLRGRQKTNSHFMINTDTVTCASPRNGSPVEMPAHSNRFRFQESNKRAGNACRCKHAQNS